MCRTRGMYFRTIPCGPLQNSNVYMDFFLSRTTNTLNRRPLFTLTQVRTSRPGIWKENTSSLPQ